MKYTTCLRLDHSHTCRRLQPHLVSYLTHWWAHHINTHVVFKSLLTLHSSVIRSLERDRDRERVSVKNVCDLHILTCPLLLLGDIHHTQFIRKIALGKTASDIGMPFWSLFEMGVTPCWLKSADKKFAPFYKVVKWAQWGVWGSWWMCAERQKKNAVRLSNGD